MSVPVSFNLAVQEKKFSDQSLLKGVAISLQVPDALGIVGPSGCGKTSLLRICAGIDRDFNGKRHLKDGAKIAMMFQEPCLIPWRKIRDNIMLTAQITRQEADDWLAQVGLDQHGDLFPSQLSLGQQRRVAFIRALAFKGDMLVLDEPFVSLDQQRKETMIKLLQDYLETHKAILLLASHNQQEIDQLTDQTLEL